MDIKSKLELAFKAGNGKLLNTLIYLIVVSAITTDSYNLIAFGNSEGQFYYIYVAVFIMFLIEMYLLYRNNEIFNVIKSNSDKIEILTKLIRKLESEIKEMSDNNKIYTLDKEIVDTHLLFMYEFNRKVNNLIDAVFSSQMPMNVKKDIIAYRNAMEKFTHRLFLDIFECEVNNKDKFNYTKEEAIEKIQVLMPESIFDKNEKFIKKLTIEIEHYKGKDWIGKDKKRSEHIEKLIADAINDGAIAMA